MFNEIQHLQEIMLVESTVDAINRHAVERDYDWCIFWVAVVSAFASVIAIVLSAILIYRQTSVAKAQAEIAIKQSEIMEQQNRIALFEKRYDICYYI